MDGDGDVPIARTHQNVRVGIAREQHRLEEHHRDRPNGRRAAEPRQHHAREHRLDAEQK